MSVTLKLERIASDPYSLKRKKQDRHGSVCLWFQLLGGLRQEGCEFEASLGYIVRP
jgi:hypothetical protein